MSEDHSIIVHGGATQNALRAQELEKENAQLKAQLEQAQRDRDTLRLDRDVLERHLSAAYKAAAHSEVSSAPLSDKIIEIMQERNRAQAACAEMRNLLENIKPILKSTYVGIPATFETAQNYVEKIVITLRTTCGRGYERIDRHAGDCTWWTYKICDCGYMMRANSHNFGEPSAEIIQQFLEHQERIQKWMLSGRGWFNVEQLKPTIELLNKLPNKMRQTVCDVTDEQIVRELVRLKALVEEANKPNERTN